MGDAWILPKGAGGLPNDYTALQFHFHWAKKNQDRGSEHKVNGERYWGEMHIVHYNRKYGTPAQAMKKPNGLAVLGFFIKNDLQWDNYGFPRITDWVREGDEGRYKGENGH